MRDSHFFSDKTGTQKVSGSQWRTPTKVEIICLKWKQLINLQTPGGKAFGSWQIGMRELVSSSKLDLQEFNHPNILS